VLIEPSSVMSTKANASPNALYTCSIPARPVHSPATRQSGKSPLEISER
jgi:hypothetical protein